MEAMQRIRRTPTAIKLAFDDVSGTYQKLSSMIREQFYSPRLIIVDDLFPNPASGFRTAEYTYLLDQFATAEVHTTAKEIRFAGAAKSFKDALAAYAATYPGPAARVRKWGGYGRVSAAGLYALFLNNVAAFLPTFERHKCGFMFTLYPGGGFALDDPVSDAKLRRVLGSPAFRGVIVTQRTTEKYLRDRGFCRAEAIHQIPGVVMPPEEVARIPLPRSTYSKKCGQFDIGFVAHKYMLRGEDKGYDRFVKFADLLSAQRSDVRFHVVGDFGPTEIPLGAARNRVTFHGAQSYSWLGSFFSGLDLIVSPNVPFKLGPGRFDGFPTGSCVHAGLAGVAVVHTDALGENRFQDGKEIILVSPDPQAIVTAVLPLLEDPDRLIRVGEAGRQAFTNFYSVEQQLEPRARILRNAFEI